MSTLNIKKFGFIFNYLKTSANPYSIRLTSYSSQIIHLLFIHLLFIYLFIHLFIDLLIYLKA